MGFDLSASVSYGVVLEGDEDFESSFGDVLVDWLDFNQNYKLKLVGSGCGFGYILYNKSHSVDWSSTLVLPLEHLEPDEAFINYIKALCRYMGIKYQEPKWLLSALWF